MTAAKRLVSTVGFLGFWLAAESAYAVSPRAYVSVNGNDVNICNVPTTPCRTYTGAISQVTPGGTVIVMDSGTFGGGTISQAVTINAPAGVVALASTPIIVNPGAGNTVVLRGLTFQAPTPGTGTGITQQSGRLFVENAVVDGWGYGLSSESAAEGLFVKGSVFRNNAAVAVFVGTGSTASVAIDGSFLERNTYGVLFAGGTGRVSNTAMTANVIGARVDSAGTEFTFLRCEVSGNSNYGLYASTSSILRVSQSLITRNGTGLSNGGDTALVASFGNNVIRGNTADTSGTITGVTVQ